MKTNDKIYSSSRRLRFVALIVSVFMLLGIAMTGCNEQEGKKTDSNTDATNNDLIKNNSSDYDALIDDIIEQALKNSRLQNIGKDGSVVVMEQEGASDSVAGDDAGTGSSFTDTNIQVEGVDEADVIKTDGRYLYVMANNMVNIIEVQQPANMNIVATLKWVESEEIEDVTRGESPAEMYLDSANNQLIVITNSYSYKRVTPSYDHDDDIAPDYDDGGFVDGSDAVMPYEGEGSDSSLSELEKEQIEAERSEIGIAPDIDYDIWIDPIINQRSYTSVYIYDIANPAAPSLQRTFGQEGGYISSRMIDRAVYIVSQEYQYSIYNLMESERIAPEMILPSISQQGSDDWEVVAAQDVAILPEGDMTNQLVLSGIDLSQPQKDANVVSLLGSSGTVYASRNSLYISGSRYVWPENNIAEDDDTSVSNGNSASSDLLPMPDIYWAPSETYTDIYRFNLSGGSISESGTGTVPGYMLNQFSMDEHNGYLRIATTTGEMWAEGENTSGNNLYVLDQSLNVVGEVTDLARGETIKSARFMGDIVWMVTFRTTDPLFGIDLSDPSQPKVMSELKLPGYSSYLHPISETRMLGFGYDVTVDGDNAYEDGLKISLFDITTITNPIEIDSLILGERGSWSEIMYQHKVLMSDTANQLFGFPVSLSRPSSSNERFSYGITGFQGLLLFETLNDQLTVKGSISHIAGMGDWTMSGAANPDYDYYAYGPEAVNRGVRIGDAVYTVSQARVQANNVADLSLISSVDLPGETKDYYRGF